MQLINEHIFLYSPGTRWKPKATIYDSNEERRNGELNQIK